MNDTFDTQLRRHLAATADERLADGQLDAIAQRVSSAGQRHPLAARLTWFPRRMTRFPSTTMRYGLVGLALILATTAALVFGGGSNTPPIVTPSPTAPGETAAPVTQAPATATPAPATLDPNCIQFDADGVYTANVGTLPVGLAVPGTPAEPWRGTRDTFFLGKASCDPNAGASVFFHAALVGEAYADACHWQGSSVEVPTAFLAAAALADQTGHATSAPVETMLGAFRATRLDVSVPVDFDASSCDDGILKVWGDKLLVPGITMQVYVAEVDGTTLVITASYDPTEIEPSELEEIDEILATLRVDM
jgi:hypothetical protein